MLVCKKCKGLYTENQWNEYGLCPKCIEETKNPSRDSAIPDWKKPLYDYACSQAKRWRIIGIKSAEEPFIRLGNYRDCAERLEKLRNEHRNYYEDNISIIRTSDTIYMLRQAINNLKSLGDFEDAVSMVELGEKRIVDLEEAERLAKEEANRQQQLKKRRNSIIKLSIAAILVIAFSGYGLIVAPIHAKKGDTLMAEGRYEEAIASYKKGQFLWNAPKLENAILSATKGLAEHLLSEDDFSGAIDAYVTLKNEYITTKSTGFTSDSYTQEIDAATSNAYLRWSDYYAEEGDAALAIEKLLLASPEGGIEKRYKELKMQQADEAIAHLKSRHSPTVEYIRKLGMPLTTLNSQLSFCRAVHDEGYDLLEIYPDGIEIEDVSLGSYHAETIWENEVSEFESSTSKLLVFERIEKDYYQEEDKYSSKILPERDPMDDSLYTIKLLPGYMYKHPSFAADSWSEATSIVLVDNVYIHAGTVTHRSVKTYGTATLSSVETEYPFYNAVNSLAVYGKANPTDGIVFIGEINEPIVSDDTWFLINKSNSEPTYIQNRIGSFDSTSSYEYLDTYLMLMTLLN